MNTAEEAFYANLTDPDSLEFIVREGFSTETSRSVIPTEIGQKLTAWSINYYFESGRTRAPTKDAILQTWGDQLTPRDITINDDVEQESIQWAVKQLRSDFIDYRAGEFSKLLARSVRAADADDRPAVLQEHSDLLHLLSQSTLSRSSEMSAFDGIQDAIRRYDIRAQLDHKYAGLTFGLPEVDDHTLGIHPGEIAIFAGTSGGGKSWFSLVTLMAEHLRNRRFMLFTLENDVEMTYDRLACVANRVPYDKWQRSECGEGEIGRVRDFGQALKENDNFIVANPKQQEATGVAMIRRAVIEDADSVAIDQLSHIQQVAGSRYRERNQIVAEIVRDLGWHIKEAGLPLALMHQINRKGREEARKTGRVLMDHMGEATQVENDAAHVFAIYQSPDHVRAEWAELQQLKFRRGKCKTWLMNWRPAVGDVRIIREETEDGGGGE